MIRIASVEAFAFRVPIAAPIKVAFGTFRDRPVVYVRVVDGDGVEGWGEAWCNWPAVGAEHRARLVADIGERLVGQAFAEPGEVWRKLDRELEVLVLQTGEVGPIAQALAGIDLAVWDLFARKRGVPLYQALAASRMAEEPSPAGGRGLGEGGTATRNADFSGTNHPHPNLLPPAGEGAWRPASNATLVSGVVETVPVYVTGINPDQPDQYALPKQAEGHRAFKLKIGFGAELDRNNIAAMRRALGPDAVLMVDANQSIDLDGALDFCRAAAGLGLRWLEEPLRVDRPGAEWQRLAEACGIKLAGGENLRGAELHAAAAGAVLQVIQPDITKWGGVTGNLPVARETVASGKQFCPHVFGGGVNLLASLHLLAAVGGDGLLEFDTHPNAGRELVVGSLLPVAEGRVPVPQTPGLGAVPDLAGLRQYQTWPE